jgi:micrococcal nuclease
MAVITWQNIQGASPAEAARPLFYAQNAINAGFDNFNKVIQDRQALETANWENQKVNNTQAFLNKLAQFQTPEALAAAKADGSLDAMRLASGAQIDQAAVRGAQDTRLKTLYEQSQAAQTYTDSQTELAHRPIIEQLTALAKTGTPEAKKEFDRISALYPALPKLGALTGEMVTGVDHAAEQLRKAAKHTSDLESAKATQFASRTNANANMLNAVTNADQVKEARDSAKSGAAFQKREEDAFNKLISTSPYSMGAYDANNPKLIAELTDGLKKLGYSEAEVRDTTYNLNKYYGKGVPVQWGDDRKPTEYVPLPVTKILQMASADKRGSFLGWSRSGDALVNALDESYGIHSDGSRKTGTVGAPQEIEDMIRTHGLINQYSLRQAGKVANPQSQITGGSVSSSSSAPVAAGGGGNPRLAERMALAKANAGAVPTNLTFEDLIGKKKSENPSPPQVVPMQPATQIQSAPVAAPPKMVGAFQAPAETKNKIPSTGISLNPTNGITRKTEAPEIPNVNWSKPITIIDGANASPSERAPQRAVMTFMDVQDGDTVHVNRPGKSKLECRLDYDAPETAKPWKGEPGQPKGEEAHSTLAGFIKNNEVTVRITQAADTSGERSGKNNYGRSLCQIEISGHNISEEMVRKGLGWVWNQYAKPVLAQQQQLAKSEKLGVFSEPNPEAPWDYRKRMKALRK